MTARMAGLSNSAGRGRGLCLALVLVVLLASVAISHAQTQQTLSGLGMSQSSGRIGQTPLGQVDSAPPDAVDVVMQEKRLKALNAERQKSMVAETNRLVKLAAELNAEVNGPHPRELSADQLRKVAEIEKLARNIREKMCTSVKAAPAIPSPLPPMIPTGLR